MEHVAKRPSWDCRACDKPWPCDPAREALMAEMDITALRMYLWINLEEAMGDLPATPVREVFERFLAWTREHV